MYRIKFQIGLQPKAHSHVILHAKTLLMPGIVAKLGETTNISKNATDKTEMHMFKYR